MVKWKNGDAIYELACVEGAKTKKYLKRLQAFSKRIFEKGNTLIISKRTQNKKTGLEITTIQDKYDKIELIGYPD